MFNKMENDAGFRADYERILQVFGFDELRDIQGRDKLFEILPTLSWKKVVTEIQKRVKDRWVVVGGNGPAGPSELEWILKAGLENVKQNCAFIAADGAARYFLAKKVVPTAIFSDLDGITPKIMAELDRKDSIFVIHAHGDNIEALTTFTSEIRQLKWVIGTTQTRPRPPIINPGGFTDGDRILYFLSSLPPVFKILLIGMDFGATVGQFSKPTLTSDIPATPVKARKLSIAVELLTKLLPTMLQPVYRLEGCYPFPTVRKLTRGEFEKT